jgi:tripartite-type tricarboxylate transporter receptor subunit TctC
MKLPRRRFLHLVAGSAALPAVSQFARAQSYPTRPVHIVVGFAPGGGQDITARLIGQWLSDRLGQSFIIENRPGAASNLGVEAVARASPGGYTLLLVGPPVAIASILRSANVMEVHLSLPVKTVPGFIEYAKANPGKLSMASGGIGTAQHVAGELFKMMTGVNLVHVPYRGSGPAVSDLLGGQVQVMFGDLSSSIEHIRAGNLRALGVTTATRLEVLPDIPTVSDFVPGYEASTWFGVGAPRNTPDAIIGRLNKEINAALADPEFKARIADIGGTILPGSPSDFGKLIVEETDKWSKVVKFANIMPG